MPPLVHCTSSTTSRAACATSCMTCRPFGPVLWPYPTLDPSAPCCEALPAARAALVGVADAGKGAPKMENEVGTAGEVAVTEMVVEAAALLDVRTAS